MNRPLTNVLFGAFGAGRRHARPRPASGGPQQIRSASADDVAIMLAYANKVVFVPGLRHGRRASAAQRQSARGSARKARRQGALRDPSGRGPHAGPHERAARRGERSVQAAARHGRRQPGVSDDRRRAGHRRERRDQSGRAQRRRARRSTACRFSTSTKPRNVVVLKRSMRSGFAGIDNPLYEMPNCSMLFGDAKASVDALTAAVKAF